MSAIEKLFVQIFDKKKRIVDHAHRQCHLFDQHLVSKLLIDGIVPPPWLANPLPPSLTSDPKDLNEDDLIFEALFSRPQSTIPFSGRHCSLHGNVVATTDDGQPQSGLHNEFQALEKDNDAGDGLSNLPDCSVNNVGRCSTSAPEMDSGALSPQVQMESRISHSHNDPALSLAKLQRSKSRQRALEIRHSAKTAKSCSRDDNNLQRSKSRLRAQELRHSAKTAKICSGDDNNAGVCASRITDFVTSSPQLDHIEGSDLVKAFDTNIQSCPPEEEKRGDCLTEKNDQSNYSGRTTGFQRLALKRNVVSSSIVKEDGPESNKAIDSFETVDPPCFGNESCRAKETDKGDYQRRETESHVYHKRLTRSRNTGQPKCDNKLLTLDTTLVRGNEVGVHDHIQSLANIELTVLSNASDHSIESEKETTKDGDRRMTVGSLKSICKSIKSPQPLFLQHSQAPAVLSDGSFRSKKDPDLCAVKEKDVKNIEGISKPASYGFRDQSSTCSKSAASNKSLNLQDTEMAAERSSSSIKDCKLNTEMEINSSEVASVAACRNTRAVTTSTTERSLGPVNSSDLDGRDSRHIRSTTNKSLLAKSLPIKTVVTEKALDTRENISSGANVTDIIEDRSAAIVKVDADFDGLVEKNNVCLGSSPKVRLDVSISRPPSDFVMSVKPKQLDFDDVEESSMCEISSPDLKVGGHDMPPEKETSLVSQDNCNFSPEMLLLERREFIREDGPQMKSCESHLKEADAARETTNAMSSKTELSVVQKELGTHTSLKSQEIPMGRSSSMNHLSSSQVACENSSRSLPKDIIASKLISEISYLENDECSSKILENATSAGVTGNGQLGNAVQTVTDLTVEFPSAAHTDELNIALTQQVPSSGNCLHQNNNLSRGNVLSDEKDAGLLTVFQIEKNFEGSFASDMEHSCPQQKRRKIESQSERSLHAFPSILEKPHESSNQRFVGGNLNIKEDNREAESEIENLTSQHEDLQNLYVTDSLTEEMESTEGCYLEEGSSLEVRLDKKFNKDERDRSVGTVLTFTSNKLGESLVSCLTEQGSGNSQNCLTGQMVVANSSGSDIGSTRRCTVGKNLDSWHAERSNSRRRIYPGENAKLSDGSSVSRWMQSSDMIGTDETRPEIEGFIIQPDEARPCTGDDHIELEKLNFPSDAIEYASILERLGMSTSMHSPLCYSSTPYRLPKIPGLHQSLPNGLGEGMMGMWSSIPLNESGKSLSDCLPNCKDESTRDVKKTYASPIQTLWDKINSKFGSSGKRESLKPELPCIDEENEAADEIDNTFQKGIGPELKPSSIRREPLAKITDNANPSSVSQDYILGDRCGLDSVAREFSFGVTHNQVKQKLENEDAGRRFTGKGKENQSISCGASRTKRTSESVHNRSSRPKLSGKISMKKGPNHSVGKSSCNNIVSNITSFIPLVQQKHAAEVITGKRDIKVKALEAAEAAKRMAEKKENERKMKKEALKLERERLEQNNLKQLELQNRKKEEERKKKEAEMAAKKRQREEEERKERERKRKRVEEVKRKHQEHEEKICAKKEEKETKCRAAGEGKLESEKCIDGKGKCKNLENNKGNTKIPSSEPLAIKNPTNDKTKESLIHSEAVNESNTGKVIGKTIKTTEDDDLIVQNIVQEQSYDISPYKGSDDEDEDDDDDVNNNKFVPSWASKHRLSLAVSSQKLVDPETVFPLQSFCSIAEVLLPRKLQVK